MKGKRQKTKSFSVKNEGEARKSSNKGSSLMLMKKASEILSQNTKLLEEVLERQNMKRAFKQVKRNKGASGVDGRSIKETEEYLKLHWPRIKQEILSGSYKPSPVRRVEIPKPSGGVRKLGIPTVTDRLIQQALSQVLQKIWEPHFSDNSYGFRPKRSAHQAVTKAKLYQEENHRWVVDIDLEKFFDQVNHDRLMSKLRAKISDKRVLGLIGKYLRSGVMENGLLSSPTEGTPQGGPLSPLLSNIVLDELDKELEQRGHKFVRYADDCNIYVRSERAGHRVMESVSKFIRKRLKLKVNEAKSNVSRPWRVKFLGFSFTQNRSPKIRVAKESLKRFKGRVKELTNNRCYSMPMEDRIRKLNAYLMGWRGYFGKCETPSVMSAQDEWIRRRLRTLHWKQWKKCKRRCKELVKLGVSKDLALQTAASGKGPWRLADSPALKIALKIKYFDDLGLVRLSV